MLTGRVTYGFGRLGQMDFPQGSDTGVTVSSPTFGLVQTPVAQWGAGEWALMLGGLYVAFAVTSTTSRGVRRARGALAGRRERLAREHEAAADYYKAKRK